MTTELLPGRMLADLTKWISMNTGSSGFAWIQTETENGSTQDVSGLREAFEAGSWISHLHVKYCPDTWHAGGNVY